MTRREAVKVTLTAAAGLMGTVASAPASASSTPRRPGGLRFAHLTDMHVQPERRGGEGYAAALRSLESLDPKPAFIVTGGDHVMDAFEQTPARCKQQWDLYERVLRENTKLPIYPVMGNHDVCGWGAPPEKFPLDGEGYGKRMAMDRLGLKSSWYAFDDGGWRFIVLDSVARRSNSYLGDLTEEQVSWLRDELARTGREKPICILSHLPVLSVCVYFDGERLRDTYWHVPDAWMHRDAVNITNLIEQYHVPLLLSGHIHLVDRCVYRGKTHICDGSVCGNWWKGAYHDCPEGYGVVDIWPDGSFEHQYVTFGWVAQGE
jgi:3',5'-cyclic AMP phosphodiesterase CpdA